MRTCTQPTSTVELLAAHLHTAAEHGRRAANSGAVCRHIPALAGVPSTGFAMAVAGVDGSLLHTGDSDHPFSIQSLSKLFALCALLRHDREAWNDVGWDPTTSGYGSVADLERNHGRPTNPFVNSGAIVVTDRLITHSGDAVASTIGLLRNADARAAVDSDIDVARSESSTGHRNSAIAHVLAEHGYLENPIDVVLQQYFSQCAITASVKTLATAALFLADRSGPSAILDEASVRRVNAVLLTSGMYGAAGDIAYRIGLPSKSGIGGGVLAVMPGKGTVCVWSPPLDAVGNSAGGVAAIDEFARLARWSVF
ncbi:glutaminase A [Mycolicibacterium komossense]|uniref:Glutaminase n=1 Tax=Mycolicibacterium komossense TaxID=1779 RepID=A0ABT3CKZ4_9MYCO|nr:glutaminase A [Mycolicibacterium komossense]MCV7230154.1 glutaminase A [Mycolicibacterium komossense]